MSGKKSRNKGANYERKIAKWLTKATGHLYKRNLTEVREGTSGDLRSDERPDYPLNFCVECKKRERLNLRDAYDQAFCGADAGEIPIAICGKNGETDLVVMSLEDFGGIIDYIRVVESQAGWEGDDG